MKPPTDILQSLSGKEIVLLLKDDRVIEGQMDGIDEHMNIVMKDGKEIEGDQNTAFEYLIVRGSNIISISSV